MSNEGIGMVSYAQNPSVLSTARDFYAVYMASCDGLNYQGLPCPQWNALTEAVRGHWYTVALRAYSQTKALEGVEPESIPSEYVFGHLPDMNHALVTWTKYRS